MKHHLPMIQAVLTCCLMIQIISSSAADANCNPSSCGHIGNISYPFRLKDDPTHCGNSSFEISCDSNNSTPSIQIGSYRYVVQAIDYHKYTIRLSDPTMEANNTCSFPAQFLDWYNLTSYGGNAMYRLNSVNYDYTRGGKLPSATAIPIVILSCPFDIQESRQLFIPANTPPCNSSSGSNSHGYTYAWVAPWNGQYFKDQCRIDQVAFTSSPMKRDASLWDIHQSLVYGFELSWSSFYCDNNCRPFEYCSVDDNNGAKCRVRMCYHYFSFFPYWIYTIGWHFTTKPVIRNITIASGSYQEYAYCPDIWFLNAYFVLVLLLILELWFGFLIVSRIIIGLPFLVWILIHKYRTRHSSIFGMIETFLQSENGNLMPIRYSYLDIKKITKNFREKLGQGGFGSVYKGKLRSGIIVAVKILNNSGADGKDFMNEVATIGRIHHVNVVKLVGYCAERSKLALVYDFVSKGSLEKYIFTQGKDGESSLCWDDKYKIAVGVARGIEYLHRGCDIQILHFDIKPHNILLDENLTPKISDFGLAKFCSTGKNTVTLTVARGTIGYVAPELINRCIGDVSYKADVYSFGMLLTEMLGLKTNLDASDDLSSRYFPEWIYNDLEKGKDIEVGEVDEMEDDRARKVRRMTIVALWCIQTSPSDRPSMSRVVDMLENEGEVVEIPPRPYEEVEQIDSSNPTWETDSNDSVALLADNGASKSY